MVPTAVPTGSIGTSATDPRLSSSVREPGEQLTANRNITIDAVVVEPRVISKASVERIAPSPSDIHVTFSQGSVLSLRSDAQSGVNFVATYLSVQGDRAPASA